MPTGICTAFSGNTIVKNVATININKHDLEFSVDPLFRKVSGGGGGGGGNGVVAAPWCHK